jgi:hypothetical protein
VIVEVGVSLAGRAPQENINRTNLTLDILLDRGWLSTVPAVEELLDAAKANICFRQIGRVDRDGIGMVVDRESDLDPSADRARRFRSPET